MKGMAVTKLLYQVDFQLLHFRNFGKLIKFEYNIEKMLYGESESRSCLAKCAYYIGSVNYWDTPLPLSTYIMRTIIGLIKGLFENKVSLFSAWLIINATLLKMDMYSNYQMLCIIISL